MLNVCLESNRVDGVYSRVYAGAQVGLEQGPNGLVVGSCYGRDGIVSETFQRDYLMLNAESSHGSMFVEYTIGVGGSSLFGGRVEILRARIIFVRGRKSYVGFLKPSKCRSVCQNGTQLIVV